MKPSRSLPFGLSDGAAVAFALSATGAAMATAVAAAVFLMNVRRETSLESIFFTTNDWLYGVLRSAAEQGPRCRRSIMPYTQYGRKLSPEHCDCLPVYGRPTIIAIGLQPAILPGVTPIFSSGTR